MARRSKSTGDPFIDIFINVVSFFVYIFALICKAIVAIVVFIGKLIYFAIVNHKESKQNNEVENSNVRNSSKVEPVKEEVEEKEDIVYRELEDWQKKEVDEGNYDETSFEEDELEEDDYYNEDDDEYV